MTIYLYSGKIMLTSRKLYFILFFITQLHSDTFTLQEDDNLSSVRNDDVKFSIEIGTKSDFWSPGLAGNVINYDTEGLFLAYGKLKLKLYDSDVFTIEKYTTPSSSRQQDDLLQSYKKDQKAEATIDGMRVTIQLAKVINYLFDKEWINGFNYEYNTRNFIGDATVKMNSVYWYGKINGGVLGQDYALLETDDRLSFKTKFTSHKLSYKWENILKRLEGSYLSLGVFDEEWSKPTFIGDTALQGELPVIFDANYYSKGLSTNIGVKNKNYNIEAYVEVGLDNEMKVIQKEQQYAHLNKNVQMYMMGISSEYKFTDVYSTQYFTTDIIFGAEMQYNQIIQSGSIKLDAETLYGLNAGIEIIF